MICPKCLTIETEGNLKCRKCGAQLFTGVFQRPVEKPEDGPFEAGAERKVSRRTGIVAAGVFVASVLVLVVLLAILELRLQ